MMTDYLKRALEPDPETDERLINSGQLCRLIGCDYTTLLSLMKRDPSFPIPTRGVADNSLTWRLGAVRAYLRKTS
ncbi:hypothetical protein [Methyloceanibacter caenitepidi]|uniref:Uncharacterized protein n=1 Tax=Methyloceanibacter caenitepidi TaxID=1384459 RepID=A0A0A8K4R6_9HYPH|nr:hypothetical protein [Methyloceanibacter caenitepidi]BAQ17918.1 hypothetical protein GL4_2484 [Methyloceanibacter caenitepidi]